MGEDRAAYLYVLANKRNGTLYVGVTNDLSRIIGEHQQKVVKGFTSRYAVSKLVYFEIHDQYYAALSRERAIKRWRRTWKLQLIESNNPEWIDLSQNRIFKKA